MFCHYTKANIIEAILKSKQFLCSYCLESFDFFNNRKGIEEYPLEGYYAMVCFADMEPGKEVEHPFFEIKGAFIAMKESWMLRNGFSPVLYIDQKMLISDGIIKNLIKHIVDEYRIKFIMNRYQ